MHVARAPPAKHSLKYLAYLAGKRKEMEGIGAALDTDGDTMMVDGDEDKETKKRRGAGVPTVSEMMRSAAMDVARDGV